MIVFLFWGISDFKISHMKELPARAHCYLVALNVLIPGFSFVSVAFRVPFGFFYLIMVCYRKMVKCNVDDFI